MFFFRKSLAKIQNGGQALDMVRPTFFLWEIIQKFFFLSLSFHILATRNNNFCHLGGSQWVPGGLLACFKVKNGFFLIKIPEKSMFFQLFKICFPAIILVKVVEGHKINFSTTKLAKKCVQKLQKLPFLAKKACFWTKNTCKIETNGPRDLNLGSK